MKKWLIEIIKDYESQKNLSEYAKGRLSAFKLCLEKLKAFN